MMVHNNITQKVGVPLMASWPVAGKHPVKWGDPYSSGAQQAQVTQIKIALVVGITMFVLFFSSFLPNLFLHFPSHLLHLGYLYVCGSTSCNSYIMASSASFGGHFVVVPITLCQNYKSAHRLKKIEFVCFKLYLALMIKEIKIIQWKLFFSVDVLSSLF